MTILSRRHKKIADIFGIWFCAILLFANCAPKESVDFVEDFPDLLNIKNIPDQPSDGEAFCFADRGAWFGFALPPDSAGTYFGGFPGPFRFTEGKWLSLALVQFKLLNADDLTEIDFKGARNKKIVFYPGRLHQYFQTEKLELQLDLWYVTGNTALIRAVMKNISADVISVIPQWQGSVFANDLQFTLEHDRLRLDLADEERFYLHPIARSSITTDYELKSNRYQVRKAPVNLPVNLSLFNYFVVTHIVEGTDLFSEIDSIRELLRQPNQAFERNVHRWNHFLQQIFQTTSFKHQRSDYRSVAVKSMLTLVNNWRKPYRGLRHGGLFPSSAARYFFGFWAWDSWKHAAALAQFAPELAKDQIRAMFDYQDESGMVADCIFAEAADNNWRNTKPPLAAWAVWKVFQADRDTVFLKEIFPQLKRYHAWWYSHRDHDGNGLCEYGSTDGSIEAAAWESGMDNAARFDHANMLKNHAGAYSMDQESVDLNSFLCAEKKYLAKIASVLQKNEEAGELLREAEELQIKIQKLMFDESTGYFYDINLQTKEPVLIQGPEGWIPLWAGVASAQQAASVREILIDASKFATFVPFPTLARDAPQLSNNYWRGPVWLDQAYFAVSGLRVYGFDSDADRFTKQLFDRLQGLKNSDQPIRENYAADTGQGLYANHFSWSAAHLLMLFWEWQ